MFVYIFKQSVAALVVAGHQFMPSINLYLRKIHNIKQEALYRK